jgi:S1-C subfamily serine protease
LIFGINVVTKGEEMKKTRKAMIIISLFFLLLFAVITVSACEMNVVNLTDEQKRLISIETSKNGVVEIFADNLQGSGFVVDATDGTKIMTNFHVVEDSETIEVRFFGETERHSAVLIGQNAQYDLALIEIDYTPKKVHIFSLGNTAVQGKSITTLGYQEGNFCVYDGIISVKERFIRTQSGNNLYVSEINAPFFSGSSGGAVIDLDGKLVGMSSFGVISGQNGETTLAGRGYILPPEIMNSFLQRVMGSEDEIAKPTLGVLILASGTVSYSSDRGSMEFYKKDGFLWERHQQAAIELRQVKSINGKQADMFTLIAHCFLASSELQIEYV